MLLDFMILSVFVRTCGAKFIAFETIGILAPQMLRFEKSKCLANYRLLLSSGFGKSCFLSVAKDYLICNNLANAPVGEIGVP